MRIFTKRRFIPTLTVLLIAALLCLYLFIWSHYKNSRIVVTQHVVGNRIVEQRGQYTAIKNYIQGANQPEMGKWSNEVTLTTQASPEFLHHLVELTDRWQSFVSLALYVPGEDFAVALNSIHYLRKCSSQVIQNVNWHLVFDTRHQPEHLNILDESPPAAKSELCNCSISLRDCLSRLHLPLSYRHRHSLAYPINVLRNVARSAAKSKYVLASDIELYPSVGLALAFTDLVAAEKRGELGPAVDPNSRHVYMLPIFEVKKDVEAPRTKRQLVEQFRRGDAIFFHRFICDECQNFPRRSEWIEQVPPNSSTALSIFTVAKRTGIWEPIYIGTNEEPFYDERLTWEGKADKFPQMYEMCLLDYNILVLDNAFIVHAPGIKYFDQEDSQKRQPYVSANSKVYKELIWSLKVLYGFTSKCD